jgi:glycosyltransferase involved in cell wall biosynthesis
MTGLTVFAATSYGPHTPWTGGRLRRENLLTVLANRGHVVDRMTLTVPPGLRSAVQSGWCSLSSTVRRRVARADVVLLGDVFCLPMAPVLARRAAPVLLDIADSPYRLLASAPGSTMREKAALGSQAAQLLLTMHLLFPLVDGATYISAADRETDSKRVRRMPPAWLVPNGIAATLFDLPLGAPPSDGYIAWLADWYYPPNRESFLWFAEEVAPRLPDALLARVWIFGAGDPRPEARKCGHPRVARLMGYAGFVNSLAAVYEQARLVLAPVTRGAGVNNKVLEPLAAGRPVITTPAGIHGLGERIGRHVTVASTPAAFATELARLASTGGEPAAAASGREAVSALSWDAAGEAMEDALHHLLTAQARRAGG